MKWHNKSSRKAGEMPTTAFEGEDRQICSSLFNVLWIHSHEPITLPPPAYIHALRGFVFCTRSVCLSVLDPPTKHWCWSETAGSGVLFFDYGFYWLRQLKSTERWTWRWRERASGNTPEEVYVLILVSAAGMHTDKMHTGFSFLAIWPQCPGFIVILNVQQPFARHYVEH